MPTTATVDFDTFSFKRVWWSIRRDILLINYHPFRMLIIALSSALPSLPYNASRDNNFISLLLISIACFLITTFFTTSAETNYPLIRKNQALIPVSLIEKFTANALIFAVLIPLSLHVLCFVVGPIIDVIFSTIFEAIFIALDSSFAPDFLAHKIALLQERTAWNTIFSISEQEAFLLLMYWLVILWFVNSQITVKPYHIILKTSLLLILIAIILTAINALIMKAIPIAISLYITLLFVIIAEPTIIKQYSIVLKVLLSLIFLVVIGGVVNLTVVGKVPANLDLYLALFFLVTIILWVLTFFLARRQYAE